MTKSAKAALRIISKELLGREISEQLNLEPTRVRDVGARVGPNSPSDKLNRQTVWSLDAGLPREVALEEHIETIVKLMEERRAAIQILHNKCSMDIFCFFSSDNGQGGIELDPGLMGRISALGASLMLDLYLSDEGDEE